LFTQRCSRNYDCNKNKAYDHGQLSTGVEDVKILADLKEGNFLTKELLVVIFAFLIFVYSAVNYSERQTLVEAIIRIEPAFLAVNLILIVIVFAMSFKKIFLQFKKVSRRAWIFLILIFIIGLLLRAVVAPRTHRLYFDEDIYLDIGKQIALDGRGCLCNNGTLNQCFSCELMKWPNGYTFMLAVVYSLFGVSENTAFSFVIALSSFATVMIFFTGYLLSKKEIVGLFAALLFALTPLLIIWSTTVATEPVFVFFSITTITMFLLAKEDKKIFLLAILLLALTVQIKTEGGILVAVVAALIFIEKNKIAKNVMYWMILFALIMPYVIHVYYASKVDTWGSSGEKLGILNMEKNIPENLIFWINGYPMIEHPIFFTIFAIIGLVAWKKSKNVFLAIWFGVIFLLYSAFYAGSVRYGVDVRYALLQYPPLLLLAGYGMYYITKIKIRLKNFEIIATLMLVIAAICSSLIYLPTITTPPEKIQEAIQARVYHDFAIKTIPSFNKSCFVLSHDPSIYLVAGQPSLQSWMGTDKTIMSQVWNRTKCVILDQDFWCGVEPYRSSECKTILTEYPASIKIADANATVGNYSFYLLKK
jgi:hypothetical protein